MPIKKTANIAVRAMTALMLLLVLMGAAVIALSVPGRSGAVYTRDAETRIWYPLETGAYTVTETPVDAYGGVCRTYTFTCPRDLTKELCIGVFLQQLYADVYIGDTPVYSLREPEEPHLGRVPGNNWAFISLNDGDAGRPVRVVVTPASRRVSGWKPVIIVSGKDQIVGLYAEKDAWKIGVSLLCVLSGLLFAAIANLLRFNHPERMELLYLGLLAVCYGTAFVLELPLVALLIAGRGRLLTYTAMTAFALTPLILMRGFAWNRPGTRVYEWLSAAEATLCLAVFAAQLTGAYDMRDALEYERALLGVCLVVIAVRSAVDLIRNTDGARRRYGPYFGVALAAAGLGDLVMTMRLGVSYDTVLALIVVLFYCVLRGTQTITDAFRRQERLREAEEELAEQRSAMLMSQIRPHFIYNTMNSIYSLCDTDPEQAKRAIHAFSRYLRMNFESFSTRRPVSILTELRHVRFYLSIEEMRFGQELTVEYDVACESFRLPPITLQPLVENAVLHGVRRKEGGGHITLATWETDEAYYIRVEDDGPGFDTAAASEDERRYHGIENVRDRLARMCGGTLTIESEVGHGTRAEIRLPKDNEGGA